MEQSMGMEKDKREAIRNVGCLVADVLGLHASTVDRALGTSGIISVILGRQVYGDTSREVRSWRRQVNQVIAAMLRAGEVRARRSTDGKVLAVWRPTRGVCQVCGCTEVSPCQIENDEELKEADGLTRYCGWANAGKTLCDGPDCLARAAELEGN